MSSNGVNLPAPWKRLDATDINGRPIFIAVVPTIEAARFLPLPHASFFKLFIASEVPQRSGDLSTEVAKHFVFGGCCYMCAWGATCSLWDCAFDYAVVIPRLDNSHDFGYPDDFDHHIMTTWHEKDSLDDARWFFTFVANPPEGFEPDCHICLALAIGSDSFGAQIEASLAMGTDCPKDPI